MNQKLKIMEGQNCDKIRAETKESPVMGRINSLTKLCIELDTCLNDLEAGIARLGGLSPRDIKPNELPPHIPNIDGNYNYR